jgi:hypothetical protein
MGNLETDDINIYKKVENDKFVIYYDDDPNKLGCKESDYVKVDNNRLKIYGSDPIFLKQNGKIIRVVLNKQGEDSFLINIPEGASLYQDQKTGQILIDIGNADLKINAIDYTTSSNGLFEVLNKVNQNNL